MEIYFDNAATTRPIAGDALAAHLQRSWYNPSAAYAPAEKVFIDMKRTREVLAEITGLGDCVFTSGGTEANNMAIRSCVQNGAHYITSAIEHPSVYETFRQLELSGAEVDYVRPRGFCIYAQDVAEHVKDNTALVSIMHVNNETGALNDVRAICRAVKQKNPNTIFHADGVQALFKTDVNLKGGGIDYYTFSAHKIHALKGTGALIFREGLNPKRLVYGGGQERELRPGTENTLGIQVFREALERGREGYEEALRCVTGLHDTLARGLSTMEGAKLHLPEQKVPHILNVSFDGIRGEVLARWLGEKGIYIGTGSACSRGKVSRTLLESGLDKGSAEGAIRISLCDENTPQEIEVFLTELCDAVKQLRRFGRR